MSTTKKPKSWWTASLAILIILGVYTLLVSWDRQGHPTAPAAPAFRARLLLSPAMAVLPDTWLTLEQYRGKIIVLNFWASWCTSCRTETALLNRLQAEYADAALVLVGMATADDPGETAKTAHLLQHQYLIAFDQDGSVARDFGVTTLPQTFVIDGQGRIRYHLPRPLQESNWAGLVEAIQQLRSAR